MKSPIENDIVSEEKSLVCWSCALTTISIRKMQSHIYCLGKKILEISGWISGWSAKCSWPG